MSSTWKLNGNSQGELKVKISGDKWASAQEKTFKKLAKEIKIDGFRKGQVPEKVAKQHISEQSIMMEAIEVVAQPALDEGIKQHELKVIARPELGIEAISPEEVTLTFKVTVEPEVKLGDYKGLDVKKEEVEVTDEDIEKEIKSLQERFAEQVVKENGTVENGDIAVIDFEGFKDGVAFEGGKGENYPLEIGSGSFIPGFEEQIIGMKAEEEKDLDVTFPENYPVEDLAGKPVVFKVKVHEIKEKQYPEVNDELIKDAEMDGIETLEDYKEKTKERLTKQREAQAEQAFENAIFTKLVENAEVEIPEVMIENESNYMVNDFAQRLASQGIQLDQYLQMMGTDVEGFKAQFHDQAKSKCEIRLVLDKIAETEKVEVTDKDLEVQYEEIANAYKMEVEKVKELINAESLKYDLRLQKAVEFVKENLAK